MNQEETKKESTISKAILDSISFPTQALKKILKTNSSPNIISKTLTLSLPEDDKSSEEKDSDSNREYKIGNYMVKYTLGKGTFGKVKLGIYIPNNEKVAIKILEKDRIIEKDDEIRVKREFDMLAQFSHPNVILVAEIFESEDSYYSVMEFCEGGELFNYIVKKNRLCEDESAFFFFQLINGLEYIHSLGIVHRDLKPENLLLTSEHILKIIDFGLSNYFHTGQKNLLSTPCGSPCYASPEMVAGKKYDGFKIDIWSCGIILYAMICGYLPFEDPDNEVLFKKILECKLDFPGYVNKLSIDLVEKILVTDPEKRITIPEIKKHPFYLKGKAIFEEGFSINSIVKNPIEKNINNNSDNKKEKENEKEKDINKEKEIEKIDINVDNNTNINNNGDIKERINNDKIDKNGDEKIIVININDNEKNNPADIGIKNNEDNISNNNTNINDKNINNNEKKKRLEKKENTNQRKKKKVKNKENKIQINTNPDINSNKKNEKKQNKLNIKISLDNNLNKGEEKNKNINNIKNITPSELENVYIPLKTEYNNNINYKFNTFEVSKEKKGRIKEKLNLVKKNNNNNNNNKLQDSKKSKESKENTLKKYFELKPKEKSLSKSKEKPREKSISKSKEKTSENKTKITLTPKKIFYIKKNIRSQRVSNIQNLSKKQNLNLKANIRKYIQQKNHRLEKLISAKEAKKIKPTFAKMNLNLNMNNKYSNNYTISQILNSFNSKNKISLKEENKDFNFQRLKTETNTFKNQFHLNKNNFFNNTIDIIKNNTRYNVSDIKNAISKNKINNRELFNTQIIQNDLRDRKKLSDIKRIKSSKFNNENEDISNYNNKTFQTGMKNHFGNKIQIERNNQNDFIYGINNFTNYKNPYEVNLNENNNNNSNNLNTILKTESSNEFYTKNLNINLSLPKKEAINNPSKHFKYLKKTKTNTQSLAFNNKSINPRLPYRPSYLKYLNNIRKAPTYTLLKTLNLKNIPISAKDRKNPYLLVKNNQNALSKKNQQVTIRNTVINFNMFDAGIILPSMKKIKTGEKFNSGYNTNTNNINSKPNKKFSKDIIGSTTMNTLNNLGNYNTINSLNQENKYNNTINRFSRINTESNKISSINSFHKLVNKMKNKQKYNKIQFNNLNNNNSNIKNNIYSNKIHNKLKSMKLNDSLKTNKIQKKNLEISGIHTFNNLNNNLILNTPNNSVTTVSNRLRSINKGKNTTFSSLITKNKKNFVPQENRYIINPTKKINSLLNNNNYNDRTLNNTTGNNKNYLHENYK